MFSFFKRFLKAKKTPTPTVQLPVKTAVVAAQPKNERTEPKEFLAEVCELLRLQMPDEGSAIQTEEDVTAVAKIVEHARLTKTGISALPAIGMKVMNLIAQSDTDGNELGRMVQKDPALTAGVLRVANSAAYRTANEVVSVRDAVVRLGMQEVGRIAGMIAAQTLFNTQNRKEYRHFRSEFDALYLQSAIRANASAAFAMTVRGALIDRVFVTALLVDIGKSIALRSAATLFDKGDLGERTPAVEARMKKWVEMAHVDVGRESASNWDLPLAVLLAVSEHHQPEMQVEQALTTDLHLVRAISALEQWVRDPEENVRAPFELKDSAQHLHLTPLQVRAAAAELKTQRQKLVQLMNGQALAA